MYKVKSTESLGLENVVFIDRRDALYVLKDTVKSLSLDMADLLINQKVWIEKVK